MNIFIEFSYKSILLKVGKSDPRKKKGLFRQIANLIGVHATYVSQVLSGAKDFTEEQLLLICEFLSMGDMETEYILALLRLERAGSKKLRDRIEKNLRKIRQDALSIKNRVDSKRELHGPEAAQFYSNWKYSAVHLLTTLQKKLNAEEIRHRTGMNERELKKIITFLLETGLIIKKGQTYDAGPTVTHLDKESPYISQHHLNWRVKSLQRVGNIQSDELMYSANFSISTKDFEILREKVVLLIKEFVQLASDSPAEEIAQFNIDLLWI